MMGKTPYEVITATREEREANKGESKARMNYIGVSLDSESEVEWGEEEDLIDTIAGANAVPLGPPRLNKCYFCLEEGHIRPNCEKYRELVDAGEVHFAESVE